MEEQVYYSDQSTYDEEDYYMDDNLTEYEEEYASSIEDIDPKPPDYASHQSDDTRSSTWSQPFKTPYTSNSMNYVYLSRQTAPKIQLYAFSGKGCYLEWEENMDDWFYYNHFKEEKRLAYAIDQLSGEAYKWWVREKAERRKYKEPTITTWRMLKVLLRKRYTPRKRIAAHPSKSRTDHAREVAGPNKAEHVRVKGGSYQNRKVGDQSSKQRALQLQAELKSKKLEDDIRKCLQEAFEQVRAIQKKERVIHQTVGTKTNKEPIEHAENVEAKLISQPSIEPSCEHKQFDSGHRLEHESDTTNESTKDENQLTPYTSSQGIMVEQSDPHKGLMSLNTMCGTQVSLTCESIHYLNNILFTRSLRQSILNFENSGIIHLIMSLSAKGGTGSVNLAEKTTTMKSLTMFQTGSETKQTEKPTSFVPEPLLMSIPYLREHCKEVGYVDNVHNLFVIVSTEEEKRFGLENVKEFRVSSSVFDKMVSSFEELTPETFSKQMGFMVDDLCDFSPDLRVSLCSHLFDMFRAKTKDASFRTWHDLDYLLKNLLIESCALELSHLKRILGALGCENMLDHLRQMNTHSKRTFDVLSLVFVKDKQVHDSKEKVIQSWINQADYGPRQLLSYHLRIWNWKYLRKEATNRGSETERWRTRREDDQRFKPPDLTHMRFLNLHLFIQIKEEPPDAIPKPTTLHKFEGKFSIRFEFISTNLLYFHADKTDLRTNPFQVGGDDMIVASSKQAHHQFVHDVQTPPPLARMKHPKPRSDEIVSSTTAEEPELVSLITCSRAKELAKEAHSLVAEGSFTPPAMQVFNISILETSPGNDK